MAVKYHATTTHALQASVVKELRSQAALLGLQRPPQVSSGSAAAAAAASQPGAGR